MVNNKTIKNYILRKTIKWLKLPHRQKRDLYPLVTISKDPIMYRNKMIHFETRLIKLELKRRRIVMSFDVLLLGKDKAVLKMPFLQKYKDTKFMHK